MATVGSRIQALDLKSQVLSLGRLAEGRSESQRFGPSEIDKLFDEFALPRPAKVGNQLSALEQAGLMSRAKLARGLPAWRLTPKGRERATADASDMDLAVLAAESAIHPFANLAHTPHAVVPPSLAPPDLISPLRGFFEAHPFETNVFGMTRFPSTDKGELDPIAPALHAAREACARHGLEFHLASDRQIVDDLWPNVAAHLWGSQFAVAFFEERTEGGLNYNLNIEVGSALALGRRLAILKDKPLKKLPTDLVGRIYRLVDLGDVTTVADQLHEWARDDLVLGSCSACPAGAETGA